MTTSTSMAFGKQTIRAGDGRALPAAVQPAPRSVRAEAIVVRQIAELEAEWLSLRCRSLGPSFYQSFAWCSAWIEACRQAACPQDVRIVTVRDQGRLVLLWPLAVGRRGPIRVLHALAEPATQYCDLLIEDSPGAAAWMDRAWEAVMAQADVDLVRLRKVRADGALHRHGAARLEAHVQATGAAPLLRRADDAGASMGRRSGRSVNALRRHLKRLSELGPVRCEVVAPAEHVAAVRQAFRLKQAWSNDRGVTSAGYSHVANVGAITAVAERGLFTMRRLQVGDETAALEIGVVEEGYYYSMIQSYDARYAQHGPGRLLWWQTFQDPGNGIEVFDFMPPSQPHKTEWTQDWVGVADYALARTFRGGIYLSASRELKPRLQALHRKMPPALRTKALEALRAWFRRSVSG